LHHRDPSPPFLGGGVGEREAHPQSADQDARPRARVPSSCGVGRVQRLQRGVDEEPLRAPVGGVHQEAAVRDDLEQVPVAAQRDLAVRALTAVQDFGDDVRGGHAFILAGAPVTLIAHSERVPGNIRLSPCIESVELNLTAEGEIMATESTPLALPVLPLDDEVVLPGMVVPLDLSDTEVRAAVEAAQAAARSAPGKPRVLLVPRVDGTYAGTGVLGTVEQVGRLADGDPGALIRGRDRVCIGAGTTGPGAALWVEGTRIEESVPDPSPASGRGYPQ